MNNNSISILGPEESILKLKNRAPVESGDNVLNMLDTDNSGSIDGDEALGRRRRAANHAYVRTSQVKFWVHYVQCGPSITFWEISPSIF